MQKRYRPNVSAVILSSQYPNVKEVFLAERVDLKNIWQFPQGGIDEGESEEDALFRELEEEIGTSDITIIAKHPEWISYDFPSTVSKKRYNFDGQIQKYFLVKLNDDNKINIQTKKPEFARYKFVKLDKIYDEINHFKKPVYTKVLEYFSMKGYI